MRQTRLLGASHLNNLPIGILGIAAILGIAVLLSSNRRAIRLRVVGAAFALQAGIAVLVLYVPAGRSVIVTRPSPEPTAAT